MWDEPYAPGCCCEGGLGRWYRDMTTCWMTVEPLRRRRLVLRIHRWIAERVLAPIARGEDPVVADLEADGALTATLIYMIPPRKLDAWRFWIFLALADLRLALAQPPMLRDEAWARRLFLIPYSIPLRRGVGRMQGDTYA
ncbi:MAG: hypothetical protein DME04_02135 [Candidatus Rokuibacteriota bacterium]|nr:MAG: hypothetical protein DME04_02135 [Candidatus Rokubacteria bacterium]